MRDSEVQLYLDGNLEILESGSQGGSLPLLASWATPEALRSSERVLYPCMYCWRVCPCAGGWVRAC